MLAARQCYPIGVMPLPSGPTWNPEFPRLSPIFAPLRPLADRLPQIGWPNTEVLNQVAYDVGRRMVNARGQRLRFVTDRVPGSDRELGFEQRTYATGEVLVRPVNWHDLFNALVWMLFPTAKAALNGRHQQALELEGDGARSPVRDALTHFDEDGVVVLSADPALTELLRAFGWHELFWTRRADVKRSMRFVVFGHALYEKALAPFIGMTGKAIILAVDPALLTADADRIHREIDRLTGLRLLDPRQFQTPRELAPLPVLGVPGWYPDNETESFYQNTEYFRPGRSQRGSTDAGG